MKYADSLAKRNGLLCPTPGLGSLVSIYSYDLIVVAEKPRVTVGREDCLINREAVGLMLRKEFMLGESKILDTEAFRLIG